MKSDHVVSSYILLHGPNYMLADLIGIFAPQQTER